MIHHTEHNVAIELSSDEEEEEDDVALVCLKRPAPVETTVECLEILDSDEEFPVCIAENEKNDHVNIEEKRGHIKEYIETEGAGILFSHTYGLVLFHLTNVWIDGEQLTPSRTREFLKVGTPLSFYDQTFHGEIYATLSSDRVLHQAIVAWTGERPNHLMKKIDNLGQKYVEDLEQQRKTFLLYLRGEVFLRCALVRVKGEVMGYISDQVGVIECTIHSQEKVNVFFHTEDVMIFRKPLSMYERTYNTPGTKLLPVGLSVSVDAREISIPGVRNLGYQAICVLAGSWPSSPYPTLLPGGKGTYSQAFDLSSDKNSTFYYLELALEAKLARKLRMLKNDLSHTQGKLLYVWRDVDQVRSQDDVHMWREQFTNVPRHRKKTLNYTRPVNHVFKIPPSKEVKTKTEREFDLNVDDVSFIATGGSSCGSSLSGVTNWSRPSSRLSIKSSASSNDCKSKVQRTWYNQDNWGLGGLRIKTEIKTEPDLQTKKIKTEETHSSS